MIAGDRRRLRPVPAPGSTGSMSAVRPSTVGSVRPSSPRRPCILRIHDAAFSKKLVYLLYPCRSDNSGTSKCPRGRGCGGVSADVVLERTRSCSTCAEGKRTAGECETIGGKMLPSAVAVGAVFRA